MIKLNKNIINLLEKIKIKEKKLIKISPNNLSKLMLPNLKKVYDCIIIDKNNEIKEENINFDKILSIFGDRTGYEASCNEVRINDYVDYCDDFSVIQLGQIIMDAWKYKLKVEYPECKFCIIFSFNKGYVTLRFHVVRENECLWLDEDLEAYKDDAIIVQQF